MKDSFGKTLVDLARQRNDIVVLSSFAQKDRTQAFAQTYPERFIRCGNHHLISLATGLALQGKKPIVATDTINREQVRHACINNANITIVAPHAGFTQGEEGPHHHQLEDLSFLRSLPHMTIIVPADDHDTRAATIAASLTKSPVYIRLSTSPSLDGHRAFTIGRAEVLQEGNDCTIIACGSMVRKALHAAAQLAEQGVHCTVINNHTIKPLDKHTLLSAVNVTGCAVTTEEHSLHGGLGSAVAELLSVHAPVPFRMIGAHDTFSGSGTSDELHKEHGLTSQGIIAAVKDAIACKPHQTTEHALYLQGYGYAHTLQELHAAITYIDDATFTRHVTKDKNDFSAWVKEAFHDHALAQQLSHCTTREACLTVLNRRL